MNLMDVKSHVSHAKICSRTQKELGQKGINLLLRHLWPVDCQTCGETLGGGKPSLVITEWPSSHEASLHHQDCKSPVWNDSHMIVEVANVATYSHVGLSAPQEDGSVPRPMVVLNPTMERVCFERDGDGWRIQQHASHGFTQVRDVGWGDEYITRDALLVLGNEHESHTHAIIALGGEPTWEIRLPRQVIGHVTASGGVVVILTHALNPVLLKDDTYPKQTLVDLWDSDDCSAAFAAIAKITLEPDRKP